MPLHNADKNFLYGQFHEKLTYRKLFFVLFNLKNPGIQGFPGFSTIHVDTEGLAIPPISSIKSGNPIIENSEAIWSEE